LTIRVCETTISEVRADRGIALLQEETRGVKLAPTLSLSRISDYTLSAPILQQQKTREPLILQGRARFSLTHNRSASADCASRFSA
jgi:hypothetical protein